MNWNDYVKTVLSQKMVFDNARISVAQNDFSISPIAKLSILMHEDLLASSEKHNIFVFPDITKDLYGFLMARVLFNIMSGRIQSQYDPHDFVPGQKLAYKDCVVVFNKCDVDSFDGIEKIYISFSKSTDIYAVPLKLAPVFQLVDSKKISSSQKFYSTFSVKKAMVEANEILSRDNMSALLLNSKTHLDGTIVFVTTIKKAEEFFINGCINSKNMTDLLYVTKLNGDGQIINLTKGQMSGNPAIAIASDFYSVINARKKGLKIQSMIIDASVMIIENQLEAIDIVSEYDVPITFITDTANSFEDALLKDRDYNEWRWNEKNITPDLYKFSNSISSRLLRNCLHHNVEYIDVSDNKISEAIALLYEHKDLVDEMSSSMIGIYERLFSIAFFALRTIVPNTEHLKEYYCQSFMECESKLEKEKKFISSSLYEDLTTVINNLEAAVLANGKNKKIEAIEQVILNHENERICIVLSDKQDKEIAVKYWDQYCDENNIILSPCILNYQEYKSQSNQYDLTIVVGWLSNKVMRSILYRYNVPKHVVLIYPYEQRWKKAHTNNWKRKINDSSNANVIHKSLNKGKYDLDTAMYVKKEQTSVNKTKVDELEDIETILLHSKYRKYRSSSHGGTEIISAVPIIFVGGYMAFYRSGHRVITVTDIIQQSNDSIKEKNPEDLVVGDFVVVRESEKDLVKEMADQILVSEGKSSLRGWSRKWKESLDVELLFSTVEDLYKKLQDAGCKKDIMTVKNWINNDSVISPQSKEDLLQIAEATGDDVLREKADTIYLAGKEVKSAHIKAGRELSFKLKSSINIKLQEMNNIDPFNIWNPISFKLEGIGGIKILKIIDVGTKIQVESINTNRLLSE